MKRFALAWVLGMALGAGAAAGDVLDEMGVDAGLVGRVLLFPLFDPPYEVRSKVLGLPFSAEHEAKIAAELAKGLPAQLRNFQEQRGHFKAALKESNEGSLDQVRLLVRLGWQEEAKAEAKKVDFEKAMGTFQLQYVCRPLEDSEDWSKLAEFLKVIGGGSDSATWQREVWREELDVAWHRGRLDEILRDAAGDPLRLAVFHECLGNRELADRLAAELLKDAPPVGVMRLGEFLPASEEVRAACLALGKRADLAVELRPEWVRVMWRMGARTTALEAVGDWVKKGGDAQPLVDVLWRERLESPSDSRRAIEDLHELLPDDLRVGFLWAKDSWKTHPAQALEVFRKLAALPVISSPKGKAQDVPSSLDFLSSPPGDDLPLLGMLGLGELDRQDVVAGIVAGQAGWGALTTVDRLRYLAAGKMDREFVAELLSVEFSQAENADLADWLTTVLWRRMETRDFPKDVAEAIVGKFAELAAGGNYKPAKVIASQAAGLVRLMGSEDVAAELWMGGRARLRRTFVERHPDEVKMLDAALSQAAAEKPRVAGIFLVPEGETAHGDMPGEDLIELGNLLRMFYPPKIRRVGYSRERDRFLPPGGFRDQGKLPVDLLDRWSDSFGALRQFLGSTPKLTEAQQKGFRAMMRCFPAGSSRRVFPEALVAAGLIDCGDAEMEKAAKDGTAALVAGEKEARGTEVFRLFASEPKGGPQVLNERFEKILNELESQPPMIRQVFLLRVREAAGRDRDVMERVSKAFPQDRRGPRPAAPKLPEGVELLDFRKPTPAAVAVALRVLGEAGIPTISADSPKYLSDAVAVLRATGEFEAWRGKEEEKLRLAGDRPVRLLRWLREFDKNAVPKVDYDRLIFAADPQERYTTQRVALSAASAKDLPTLLAALRAMGSDLSKTLASGEIMGPSGKAALPEFMEVVRSNRPKIDPNSQEALIQIHRHFLKLDPAQAAAFRDWLATDPVVFFRNHAGIARQLIDAGRKDEAVETVVRALLLPETYPGFPQQFPPKIFESGRISFLKTTVELMKANGLFEQVAARLQPPAAVDPLLRATFQLAAHPDMDTLEREVLPITAALETYQRRTSLNGLVEICKAVQAPDEVRVRLLTELVERKEKPNSDYLVQDFQTLREAASQQGGGAVIAKLWPQIRAVAIDPNDRNHNRILSDAQRLLGPMLMAADDATWRDYWSWRDALPERLMAGTTAVFPWRPLSAFADPARLRQVLPRLLAEDQTKSWAKPLGGLWALAAVATQDPELIRMVRAKLLAEAGEDERWTKFCDLALGDFTAISPRFNVRMEDDGNARISWNLATLPSENPNSRTCDFPCLPVRTLDGKFNLRFSVMNEKDVKFCTSPAAAEHFVDHAAVVGHISVKLAKGQQVVSMWATDRNTNQTQGYHRLDENEGGLPFFTAITDRLEEHADAGPAGMTAWRLRARPEHPIELFRQRWQGTNVDLEGWTAMSGFLQMNCLDGAGKVLRTLSVKQHPPIQPVWRHFRERFFKEFSIPPETVQLVVVGWAEQDYDRGGDFAIADVRMRFGELPDLPKGFERVGRVPEKTVAVTISPDGTRLAAGLKSGKWVIVDLASGGLTELPFPQVSPDKPEAIRKVLWIGEGIFSVSNGGEVSRVNLETGAKEPKLKLWDADSKALPLSLQLSPDGKWFAWQDANRRLSLVAANDRLRRNFVLAQSFEFELTADVLRLSSDDGSVSLLATRDFAVGKPVPVEGGTVAPWVRFEGDFMPHGFAGIQVPVGREAADIGADGVVYFVDELGNIVRGRP